MTAPIPLPGRPWSVPVQPDGDQARDWLLEELGRPVYQSARPTWFDLASDTVFRWLGDLLAGAGDGSQAVALVVIVLVLTGLIVGAFLLFGRPRLDRRRRTPAGGGVFGDHDTRDAASLRASAAEAAAARDWTTAIEEQFRALARGLDERTLLDPYPGMTARGVARAAAEPFPESADRLGAVAADFDDVRYLGRPGTEEQYRRVADLERDLRTARPAARAGA